MLRCSLLHTEHNVASTIIDSSAATATEKSKPVRERHGIVLRDSSSLGDGRAVWYIEQKVVISHQAQSKKERFSFKQVVVNVR